MQGASTFGLAVRQAGRWLAQNKAPAAAPAALAALRHFSSSRVALEYNKAQQDLINSFTHAPPAEGLVHFKSNFYGFDPTAYPTKLAVVKVGGAVITEQADILTKNLITMVQCGLFPIVVHGGGPQLNDRLKAANIEAVYEEGMRVTDEKTLKIAVEVFKSENQKLINAINAAGFSATPFVGTPLLVGKFLDFNRWKYVGKITGVRKELLEPCLKNHSIPVIGSLAMADDQNLLNVNADVVAAELAKTLQPLHTVYLNTNGGLFDDKGNKLPEINLKRDYADLMKQPWVKYGTKLKINEVKDILSTLPDDAAIDLTSPEHLPRVMLKNMKGGYGTTVHKGVLPKTVGIIGARGYVGRELMKLVAKHPHMDIACVSSRALEGTPIKDTVPELETDKKYVNLEPKDLLNHQDVDCWVLAMPNNLSKPFVDAVKQMSTKPVVVDLSADWRFTDEWQYGMPERFRKEIRNAQFISNPGCYATGAQLSILPLKDLLKNPPMVFGVSGYSGAGTTPSPKNDPAFLKDNIIPYTLTNHIHEREVSRQVGHPIHFTPHVASWFQGIHLTTNIVLNRPTTTEEVYELFKKAYAGEKLVHVQKDAPLVRDNAGKHHVVIGGFEVSKTDPTRVVVCATIDNLLKGAATQCLQNMNVALGLDEYAGILH